MRRAVHTILHLNLTRKQANSASERNDRKAESKKIFYQKLTPKSGFTNIRYCLRFCGDKREEKVRAARTHSSRWWHLIERNLQNRTKRKNESSKGMDEIRTFIDSPSAHIVTSSKQSFSRSRLSPASSALVWDSDSNTVEFNDLFSDIESFELALAIVHE